LDVEIDKIFVKIIILLRIFRICWWRKNIIVILLRLELLVISLYTLLNQFNSLYIAFYILVIATIIVRASSLGLSLIVSLSRAHNSSSCSFIWNIIFENNNIILINNYSLKIHIYIHPYNDRINPVYSD